MKSLFISLSSLLILLSSDASAQWVQTDGPYGGTVVGLVANGTNLLAGYVDGGLYLSTDKGDTWAALGNGLPGTVGAITVQSPALFVGVNNYGVFRSTDNGATWKCVDADLPRVTSFAAIDTNLFAAGVTSAGGIHRSNDGGTTWIPVSQGMTSSQFHALVAVGTNLFAGTRDAVYLSTNFGLSWTSRSAGLPAGNDIWSLVSDGQVLFAGTSQAGVYLSTNTGESWTALDAGIPAGMGVFSLVVSGTELFAGTYDGVFRSTNNGASWTGASAAFRPDTKVRALALCDTTLFAGTPFGIYRSTNKGAIWTWVDSSLISNTFGSLAVGQKNLFAGTFGSVFVSANKGMTWRSACSGLPANDEIRCFAFSGANVFAGIGSGGVYLSVDSGASWTPVNNGLPLRYGGGPTGVPAIVLVADEAGGTHLLAGTKDGAYSSVDLGTSWIAANSGMLTGYRNVTSFASTDTNLFAGTTSGQVYLSSDGGTTWSSASSGLPSGAEIAALASAGSELFAGTYFGLYRSSNSGTTWTQAPVAPLSSASVESFAVSGSAVFVGTYSNGIYLSTDKGVSWTPVNTGLPANTSVFSLAVNGTDLFAGPRNRGVWRRPLSEMIPTPTWQLVFPPNGSTLASARFTFRWHPYFGASRYHAQSSKDSLFRGGFLLNDSTTTIDTTRLAYNDVVDSTWINPTEGRWYWRLRAYTAEGWTDWSPTWSYVYSITETGLREPNSGPMSFRLEQNYPNPFNPLTVIKFTVGGVGDQGSGISVELAVYDVLGREVAVLINERKAPGSYGVQFDGSGLSSGVYICRMTAGSYGQSVKMILMK